MSWPRKYAPATLDAVVYPDITMRNRFLGFRSNPSTVPNLLLYGHVGTGKSTLANVLPIELGANPAGDVFRVNGSMNTGIDFVREIENFAKFMPYGDFGKRVLVIDECDGLSVAAQRAMKGVIDDLSECCLFIFTTNYIDKVDNGIKSRCECCEFTSLDMTQIVNRCSHILNSENVTIDKELLRTAVMSNRPDMRTIVAELQRLVNS